VIGEIFKRNLIGIIQIVAIPLVGLFLLGQYFFESSYDFFFGNEDHSLETGHNLQLGISRELIIGNDRKYLLRYSSKSAKAINEFSQYVGFIDMYDLYSERVVLSEPIKKENLIKHAKGRDGFLDEVMYQLITLSNREDNLFANAIIPIKDESTIIISGKNWISKDDSYYTELDLKTDTALDISGLEDSYIYARNVETERPYFIRFNVRSSADTAEVEYSSNQGTGEFTIPSVSSYFSSNTYPDTFTTFGDYLALNTKEEGSMNWIYIFNRKNGDLVRKLCCNEGWTSRVISSAAGSTYIASGGYEDQSIKLWNVSTLLK
jgi:hypothetical protein